MKLVHLLLSLFTGFLFFIGAVYALICIAVYLFVLLIVHIFTLLVIWMFWLPQGKDVLFVYSESPNWEDYLKAKVMPQIEERAYFLNWSKRSTWRFWKSFRVLVFNVFAGSRDLNPLALHFTFGRWPKAFRLLRPLLDCKHGDEESLNKMLAEFYQSLEEADERRARRL